MAWAAADVGCAVVDVEWARLVAVDFDAGAKAEGEDAAWHSWN